LDKETAIVLKKIQEELKYEENLTLGNLLFGIILNLMVYINILILL
jgi:hypothetical protein